MSQQPEHFEKDINVKFNEEEFLKKVEEAASRGVNHHFHMFSKQNKTSIIVKLFYLVKAIVILVAFLFICMFVLNIKNGWANFSEKATGIFKFDVSSNHEQVLQNNGLFGYTAADFADAMLGDKKFLKNLEVYSVEMNDVTSITDAGLLGWKIFEKTKVITYKGVATYTIDLSKITLNDILVDKNANKVIIKIPEVKLQPININENDIQFADTERGLLAFGEMKLKIEDSVKVQRNVRLKMEEKLKKNNEIKNAKKFAEKAIWEEWQPIITQVAPGYVLEIKK